MPVTRASVVNGLIVANSFIHRAYDSWANQGQLAYYCIAPDQRERVAKTTGGTSPFADARGDG